MFCTMQGAACTCKLLITYAHSSKQRNFLCSAPRRALRVLTNYSLQIHTVPSNATFYVLHHAGRCVYLHDSLQIHKVLSNATFSVLHQAGHCMFLQVTHYTLPHTVVSNATFSVLHHAGRCVYLQITHYKFTQF